MTGFARSDDRVFQVVASSTPGPVGSFYATGSLATARFYHTATLLPDGEVLVAGGSPTTFAGNAFLASVELYNPTLGTWREAAHLGFARGGHTATLLPNGKVLVAGGYTGFNPLNRAELYDPATGTWMPTGNLHFARDSASATLLPNGKVLLAAGFGDSVLASAELYDPETGTWATTGSLVTARDTHSATLLFNGQVLVAGGTALGTSMASAELFNPVNGTWTPTGSLAHARDFHTATLLPNGTLLVVGGGSLSSAELYDPASGTWTATASLTFPRGNHTMTQLTDGQLLVAGGQQQFVYPASAELYDPSMGTWRTTGSLASPRAGFSATRLLNGNVLVAGGYGPGLTPTATAELYVGPPPRPSLLNISTRMRVLADDEVLIGGFIITGTDLKRILIRGIGPSLNGVGIALANPTLELHQGNLTLASNDNWKTRPDGSTQQADIEATAIPPTHDLESAILVALSPGAYTAILGGKNGGTGVGLVEVYDLGQGANSQSANISTRGFVDTGDNVMIGGLIVGNSGGTGTTRVVVRAMGPSLSVAGALGDPTLELHDGSGTTIAFNDNWKTRPDGGSQQAEIEASGFPPANDLESALLETLAPGSYTAIVRGMNGATGIGLVEAYNLQ